MPSRIVSSSIGTKVLVAITGICLFLFLISHLAGNLLVFVGPAMFNEYSHKLVSNPIIWIAEAGLLAVFVTHVWKAVTNYLKNRGARPVRYTMTRNAGGPSRKSPASSTMIVTGLVTLVFVVLHLKTFKFGPYYEIEGVRDLYRLEVEVFSNPLYVAFYVACMVLIGFHLWHGVGSSAESLGIDHPRRTPFILKFSKVMAVILAGGFLIIPIVIFLMGGRS